MLFIVAVDDEKTEKISFVLSFVSSCFQLPTFDNKCAEGTVPLSAKLSETSDNWSETSYNCRKLPTFCRKLLTFQRFPTIFQFSLKTIKKIVILQLSEKFPTWLSPRPVQPIIILFRYFILIENAVEKTTNNWNWNALKYLDSSLRLHSILCRDHCFSALEILLVLFSFVKCYFWRSEDSPRLANSWHEKCLLFSIKLNPKSCRESHKFSRDFHAKYANPCLQYLNFSRKHSYLMSHYVLDSIDIRHSTWMIDVLCWQKKGFSKC